MDWDDELDCGLGYGRAATETCYDARTAQDEGDDVIRDYQEAIKREAAEIAETLLSALSPFDRWLAGLPESENVVDRRDEISHCEHHLQKVNVGEDMEAQEAFKRCVRFAGSTSLPPRPPLEPVKCLTVAGDEEPCENRRGQ
jgi:hypothetical protein